MHAPWHPGRDPAPPASYAEERLQQARDQRAEAQGGVGGGEAEAGRVADRLRRVAEGLVGDLAKMMRAADLSAEVEIAAVPLSDAARAAIAAEPAT